MAALEDEVLGFYFLVERENESNLFPDSCSLKGSRVSMIENRFLHCHPFVIFCYYVCVGILAMYFNHPVFLLIFCFLLLAVNYSHNSLGTLRKWLPMMASMSAIIILMNMFFVLKGSTVLFVFLERRITLEATVYGVVMTLSIISIILLFISFNQILNGNRFLYIFSKFLPRTAFLAMLTIRFVPLLKRRLTEITDVQRIKGISIKTGTMKQRCKAGMTLIQILLTWSLEEAVETADSMKTRGYGIGKRSPYNPYKLTKEEKVWLLLMLGLLVVSLVGGSYGYGRMMIYPKLDSLQLRGIDGLFLLSSILLFAFPLFVEGREQLRWKSLR